jgi:hypothetical protein
MKKLLIIFAILFCATSAWSATYYVDDSTVGGDGSSGTPWDEIQDAEDNWSAADKILFKCGDSWTNDPMAIDEDGLTIGAYYGADTEVTDAATLASCGTRPQFINTTAGVDIITILSDNIDDITIRALWIDNNGDNGGAGADSDGIRSISIDSETHVFDMLDIDAADGDGIQVNHTDGVTVTDCDIDVKDEGTIFYGVLGFPRDEQVRDVTITGNTITSASGDDHITIHRSDGQSAGSHFTASDNGSTTTLIDADNGSLGGFANDDFILCELYFSSGVNEGSDRLVTDWDQASQTFTFDAVTTATQSGDTYQVVCSPGDTWVISNNTLDGTTVESNIDVRAENVTISENYMTGGGLFGVTLGHGVHELDMHHNMIEDSGGDANGACIAIGKEKAYYPLNNDVHHNLCIGDFYAGIRYSGYGTNINVYNNSFIHSDTADAGDGVGLFVLDNRTAGDLEFKNNIVYSANSGNTELITIRETGFIGDDIILDGNQYYHTKGNQVEIFEIADDYSKDTLAEVQSEWSQESNGQWGDPLFGVDEQTSADEIALEHFYLQSTSPCINEGGDIGEADGFRSTTTLPPAAATLLDQDANGSAWEIGAFVYYDPEAPPAEGDNDFSGDANCVALYLFEDGALTTDSKGTNTLTNSGTVVKNISEYQEGDASADFESTLSQHFYRTDGDLDAGFPLKVGDATKDISVVGWFKLEKDGLQYLWGKHAQVDGDRSIGGYVNVNNYVCMIQGHTGGNSQESICLETAIVKDRWYHFGMTYDESDTQACRISVHDFETSALIAADKTGNFANAISVGDASFYIGARGTTARYYSGEIDELAVFKDVLTEAEILQMHNRSYVRSEAHTASWPATVGSGGAYTTWAIYAATDQATDYIVLVAAIAETITLDLNTVNFDSKGYAADAYVISGNGIFAYIGTY